MFNKIILNGVIFMYIANKVQTSRKSTVSELVKFTDSSNNLYKEQMIKHCKECSITDWCNKDSESLKTCWVNLKGIMQNSKVKSGPREVKPKKPTEKFKLSEEDKKRFRSIFDYE